MLLRSAYLTWLAGTISVATMCCSVLQRVAVCCSMMQCVAVCCSVLQCVNNLHVCDNIGRRLLRFARWLSSFSSFGSLALLQEIHNLCCNMLQRVAVRTCHVAPQENESCHTDV